MNTIIDKSRPKISIIIPVYNASAFIAKTIENLLEQNIHKEIILINDGSTDNSLEVINKFKNKFEDIRVINQENKGVSAARNNGIANAKGDYILFIDSDDLLEEKALEKLQTKYETYDCDLALCTYKICFEDDTVIDKYKYMSSGFYNIQKFISNYYELFTTRILHCIGTKLYKKSIIDQYKIRFDESLSYFEDINFCLSYLKRSKKIYFINEGLYKYMQINENSLANRYKVNFAKISNLTLKSQKELLETIYGPNMMFEEFNKIVIDDFNWGIRNEINHKNNFIEKYKNINELIKSEYIYKALKEFKNISKNKIKTAIIRSRNAILIMALYEAGKLYKKIR